MYICPVNDKTDSHKSDMADCCWHQKKLNDISLPPPDGKNDEPDGINSKLNLVKNAARITGQKAWPQNATNS